MLVDDLECELFGLLGFEVELVEVLKVLLKHWLFKTQIICEASGLNVPREFHCLNELERLRRKGKLRVKVLIDFKTSLYLWSAFTWY